MRFSRAYIEITNHCALNCSFCEPTKEAKNIMDLGLFEKINQELAGKVKDISYHLLGDPLTVTNLRDYLDVSAKYNFDISLTTSGFFLQKQSLSTLFHPVVKQINISLSSFFANQTKISFDEYMHNICEFAKQSSVTPKRFVNLRLWNFGNLEYVGFNNDVIDYIQNSFGIDVQNTNDKIRITDYTRIVKDVMFEWPSAKKMPKNTIGSCHAISAQIAFLSNGDIVPCCLDAKGDMKLGSMMEGKLSDALNTEKASRMLNGFRENRLVEHMCQTCGFRESRL